MRKFKNRVDNTVHCKWRNLIGRVIYIDGGIGYFTTPHGTIIRSGIAWLGADVAQLTEEERRVTVEYILNARKTALDIKIFKRKRSKNTLNGWRRTKMGFLEILLLICVLLKYIDPLTAIVIWLSPYLIVFIIFLIFCALC